MNSPAETAHSGTVRPLELLIVQLGTLSEVLRSLMALKAVKQLYPATRVRMLVRSENLEPVSRVEWIEETLTLPRGLSRETAIQNVATWLGTVVERRFDILANWTGKGPSSKMSAIATTLIPAIVKLGDHLREDMSQGSYDAWSMYRHAWSQGGVEQDIHETDLVTTQLLTALQIHAGEPSQDAGNHQVTSRYFFKTVSLDTPGVWTSRPKGLKWIAVSAASAPGRVSEWMERVLRRNPDYGMVVVGAGEIRDLPDSPRIIRLADDSGWDALLTVFSQCSWLCAGSDPMVDLASLVNLRVFFSAGSESREFGLKWAETGPYGNGHVVLVSSSDWDPDAAYATWSYFQSEWFHKNSLTVQGHFDHLGCNRQLESVQIYKSRIRPSSEGGGVCYEQTAGAIQEFESWIYRVRGQMARAWFCGWLPALEQEAARLTLSPSLIKRIRSLQDSVQVISQIVQGACGTARELETLASRNRSGHLMSVEDREAIEICGKKLLEMEALIGRVTRIEPELECLLKWYRQRVHNLSSQTLSGMAKETLQALDLMVEGMDLLNAWTSKTLELARPRAVEIAGTSGRGQGLTN
jgi:hypothetical protein